MVNFHRFRLFMSKMTLFLDYARWNLQESRLKIQTIPGLTSIED
jgi:hypothetical protein